METGHFKRFLYHIFAKAQGIQLCFEAISLGFFSCHTLIIILTYTMPILILKKRKRPLSGSCPHRF